jgi:Galactose oxidase, central domain
VVRFLWTQKQDMGPAARVGHAMSYDSMRGRTVLFGGDSLKSQLFNDTWEWDGALWTQMANFGPPVRCDHAMAYDGAHREVVIFGGWGASGTLLGDTWGWNGEDWTQLADSGPPKRSGHCAAYDSARQKVVIFGGTSDGTTPLGDTWEWDGQDWTQVAETGPTARKGLMLAFDSGRNTTVLFGGAGADGVGLGDTWEWDGTAWTRVPPILARLPARTQPWCLQVAVPRCSGVSIRLTRRHSRTCLEPPGSGTASTGCCVRTWGRAPAGAMPWRSTLSAARSCCLAVSMFSLRGRATRPPRCSATPGSTFRQPSVPETKEDRSRCT